MGSKWGGGVITGTITPTQAGVISVALDEYGLNLNNRPMARYLFEDSGISSSDKTHETVRPLAYIAVAQSRGKLPTSGSNGVSSFMALVYQEAGSNRITKSAESVSNFWDSFTANSTEYGFFNGAITNSIHELYFYAKETTDTRTHGLIVGRTYRWGLVL